MKTTETKTAAPRARLKLTISGAVQGVGFRPFVHRLATELALTGRVQNSPQGVSIEVEGLRATLEQFSFRLRTEKPPRSFIQSCEAAWLDPVGFCDFQINHSETVGGKTALILPDIAICPDCRREIFDPANRRHRYPFTNCTNCGPRFTIIEALPYDRAKTTMKQFIMCPVCQAEYDDPCDRRFHAQPNACPVCGPRLELWDSGGKILSGGHESLLAAAESIRRGQIAAVKGIGGFHLLVDARNDEAVRRLRERKQREEKPFALMFPSLESVKIICEASPLEERLLLSPEAPIVLLRKIGNWKLEIGNSVAPGNPNLGVMLPSNPLHYLLLAELGFPVVATSGNLSDEPICTDESEALDRLRDIADVFLVHNRPIVRHMDDSIVRVMSGREMILRRARGYAPLPVQLRIEKTRGAEGKSEIVLAVGAHLKNSVALAVGENVFISQHIGDLETEPANIAFRRVAADLPRLYVAQPKVVAADLHPDYLSTKFAQEMCCQRDPGSFIVGSAGKMQAARFIAVQHHVAHVLSCIAENEVELPSLGVAWDGTGFGTDGTIWGGEFFLVTENDVERVAHLRPFRLPGGDAAVKEPRRAALGLLHEMSGDGIFAREDLPTVVAFSDAEIQPLATMLKRGLNAPVTSSVGRLFDAVASLTGLRQKMRFEGQAAMELEFALDGIKTDEAYELRIADCGLRNGGIARAQNNSALILDWSPLVEEILADVKRGVSVSKISSKFHNALAEAVVQVAKRAGQPRVVLSGGCFQNRYLTERAITRLRAGGFQPYWHQRVPANDGGIALGQVFAVKRRLTLKN